MNPSHPARRGQVQPALAIALGTVAVVGIVAAVLVSRPSAPAGPTASDRPSASPSSAPSPTPVPMATPSSAPSAGIDPVDLRNATGHKVTLRVHDQTGALAGVVSGTPGDGMSIQWHKALVENVDDDTIRVTWAGLPQDDTLDLEVAIVGGDYRVTIVQAGPVPDSDAMGEDRVIALTFDGPVPAGDVVVRVLDRTVD